MISGFIYKIWSAAGEKVYIGSTRKLYLSNRWAGHRSKYRLQKGRPCASSILFDEYGMDNCSCEMLEKVCADSLEGLRLKEQEWIEKHPTCVNKVKAGPMTSEAEKECKHKYYLSVKDSEEYKEKAKEARLKHAPKRKEVIQCECGGTYTLGHRSRHFQSKAHQGK